MARGKNGQDVPAAVHAQQTKGIGYPVILHCVLDAELTGGYIDRVDVEYRRRFNSAQGAYNWLDDCLIRGYDRAQTMEEAQGKGHYRSHVYVMVRDPSHFEELVMTEPLETTYLWTKFIRARKEGKSRRR